MEHVFSRWRLIFSVPMIVIIAMVAVKILILVMKSVQRNPDTHYAEHNARDNR